MNLQEKRLERKMLSCKEDIDFVLKQESKGILRQAIEITYDNEAIEEAKLAWVKFSNKEELKQDKEELFKNYQNLKNNQVDNLADIKEMAEDYLSMIVNKELVEITSKYCIDMKKSTMLNLDDLEKAKGQIRYLDKHLQEIKQYAEDKKQLALKMINKMIDAAIEDLK